MSETVNRRLAAILAADVVGYSKLMAADEAGTLAALKTHRRDLFDPETEKHGGRIFKVMGDGVLVEFPSVVDAVECAIAIQNRLKADGGAIVLRIGVHLGDVMIDGDDIYGDGVNVAARLEPLAEPGGIAISSMVNEGLGNRVKQAFADAGEHQVKNIDRPLRVYKWHPASTVQDKPVAARKEKSVKPSIAVLPFNNMSGDAEQEYFADGIAEDVITDLSKVSGLLVIARNSSFAYKGQSPDIRKVCRDLDVRYVLEGSVRKAGDKVRINAQLIEGETGGHLWADRYDRKLEDIFALQDEVTREIVSALQVAFTSEERKLRKERVKVDPIAYDYMVRARNCVHQLSAEGMAEARTMLDRAIETDPGLALAYALYAATYCIDYASGWNGATEDSMKLAMDYAQKAVAADENEPQAYFAMALAHGWMKNLDEAERAAERALQLDPNHAGAYVAMANAHTFRGDYERAIEMLQNALRLDPQYNMALQFLGRAQFLLGRYDEAEASFKRRLVQTPRSDMTRAYLASLYGHTGRVEEARAIWREMLEINPKFSPEHLRDVLPFQDLSWFDHFMGGLKKAGLPE